MNRQHIVDLLLSPKVYILTRYTHSFYIMQTNIDNFSNVVCQTLEGKCAWHDCKKTLYIFKSFTCVTPPMRKLRNYFFFIYLNKKLSLMRSIFFQIALSYVNYLICHWIFKKERPSLPPYALDDSTEKSLKNYVGKDKDQNDITAHCECSFFKKEQPQTQKNFL